MQLTKNNLLSANLGEVIQFSVTNKAKNKRQQIYWIHDNGMWPCKIKTILLKEFVSQRLGCFPLCQRFQKFRPEVTGKVHLGSFRPEYSVSPLEVHGSLISVGIFQSKLAVPFLTNRFIALLFTYVANSEKE